MLGNLHVRFGVGAGVKLPGLHHPATTGYANWHSGQFERLVPVGSSPTSVTGNNTIPWSNGKDAWVTTRKVMVQLHPGPL